MRPLTRSAAALATLFATLTPLAGVVTPAGAQDVLSKLSIHGYLTQGAAVSDSSTVIGIAKHGTTNYRRAAILLRYTQTPNDAFVIQGAHRRLGDSPVMAYEPDVKIDWAFYERKFGGETSLRVGKAPIPYGIYNETRYTGTLLPFYRAPYAFYFEGAYTSETIDGAVLSHAFLADSPFRVDASVYGGNYSLLEFNQVMNPATGFFTYVVGKAQAENAVGGQLWVSTPIEGLRVGGGAGRATMDGGVLRKPGLKETQRDWHAGIDGAFDRFAARGEYRGTIYRNLTYRGYYGQAGARVFGPLSVNAQGEVGTVEARNGATYRELEIPLIRDYAVGVNYAFRSDLLLKLEGHRTKGFNIEDSANIFTNRPSVGRYYISSLSLAF